MEKHSILCTTLLAFGLAGAAGAQATVVSASFTGNDCAGVFGQPFDACQIGIGDETDLSPIIAKFDYEGGVFSMPEVNGSVYPSVTGSEFTLTPTGMEAGTGTWSYTPDDADDPFVRFWAAKAGDGFTLFWSVADAATQMGGACYGVTYTLGCLLQAQVVSSGTWTTPELKGLSHIAFYDTGDDRFPPSVIPVPAAVWLFGSGLLGLIGVARRRS